MDLRVLKVPRDVQDFVRVVAVLLGYAGNIQFGDRALDYENTYTGVALEGLSGACAVIGLLSLYYLFRLNRLGENWQLSFQVIMGMVVSYSVAQMYHIGPTIGRPRRGEMDLQ